MRLVILGAGGMLGQQVVRAASTVKGIDVCSWNHQELDITDKERVGLILSKTRPQILINCAGIVKSRDLSDEVFEQINGTAPQMLADLCDANGVRMVQVSTDCVFDGDGPHYEPDEPTATDVYGKSKILGEVNRGKHLTVRCSFIGLGERGLLAWLQQQSGRVPGFVNVLWNGLTVQTAAEMIIRLGLRLDLKGIHHIYGRDTTKYHVLRAANEVLGLGLDIYPVDTPVADFRLRTHNIPWWALDDDVWHQLKEQW